MTKPDTFEHAAKGTPATKSGLSESKLEKIKKKAYEQIVKRKMEDGGLSKADAERAAKNSIQELADSKTEEVKSTSTTEFDHDFLKIYMDEPFIGTISAEVSKVADYDMPTAYVGMRPNGRSYEVIMGFNPNFMRSLNAAQRKGVIKHEMYHLIFQHIFERAPGDKKYQVLWNWATDLAINSIIGKNNLPDMCLIPGHSPIDPATGKEIEGPYAEFIKSAPLSQSSDFYFEKLREIEQEQKKQGNSNSVTVAAGNGMGSMDDHGKWGEVPKEVREQLKGKVRDMMEKAARKAEKSADGWGSVPSEIAEVIRKIISKEVDWRSILRQFIGRCRSMERHSTIKRLNKKAPYLFPGHKRKYRANFVCFIDQSGSMSDTDIGMLFSELGTFAGYTDLDVYHFDTEVDERSHTKWKKGSAFPKAHRTRCGGTDFDSIREFCNRRENRGKWSGIVILTDGFAPTMGQVLGTRIIWVITETGTMSAVRKGDLAVQMKKTKQFKRY